MLLILDKNDIASFLLFLFFVVFFFCFFFCFYYLFFSKVERIHPLCQPLTAGLVIFNRKFLIASVILNRYDIIYKTCRPRSDGALCDISLREHTYVKGILSRHWTRPVIIIFFIIFFLISPRKRML